MSYWYEGKQDPHSHWERFKPKVKPSVGKREILGWFEEAEQALARGLGAMRRTVLERREADE